MKALVLLTSLILGTSAFGNSRPGTLGNSLAIPNPFNANDGPVTSQDCPFMGQSLSTLFGYAQQHVPFLANAAFSVVFATGDVAYTRQFLEDGLCAIWEAQNGIGNLAPNPLPPL
ncbi:MAG: hypothetical protein ACSHYF_10110 [Verrucomicrobiaceae bacterium]